MDMSSDIKTKSSKNTTVVIRHCKCNASSACFAWSSSFSLFSSFILSLIQVLMLNVNLGKGFETGFSLRNDLPLNKPASINAFLSALLAVQGNVPSILECYQPQENTTFMPASQNSTVQLETFDQIKQYILNEPILNLTAYWLKLWVIPLYYYSLLTDQILCCYRKSQNISHVVHSWYLEPDVTAGFWPQLKVQRGWHQSLRVHSVERVALPLWCLLCSLLPIFSPDHG